MAALAATAAPSLPAAEAGVLRIATPGDYAPYAWRSPDAPAGRGADVALTLAIATRLGMRAEFVPTSWPGLAADAAAGRFDLAAGGISITPERAARFAFSRAYTRDRKQPVVRCGEQRRFDTLAEIDRPGVRVVVNPGGTNEQFARQHLARAGLRVHADNRTIFEEILAGRADVMVTDAVEGRLQQRQGRGLCIAPVRGEWSPARKALLVPAGGPLHADVDRALRALGGSRAYRAVQATWEGFPWSRQEDIPVRMAGWIDTRLQLAIEVARAKWNSGAPIADPAREQALLQAMRERGAALGVPGARVERFFQAQIDAARLLQESLFAQWRRERRGRFAGTLDLVQDIRPRIDAVNGRMLELLAQWPADGAAVPAATTLALVSPRAAAQARAPLALAPGT